MITGEQLSAYLAGELDAEERAAVEAALERDPDLRARLQRLRASEEALGSLPPVAPPDGFSDRLHAALDHELDRTTSGVGDDELAERRRTRFGAFRPLAVAAAAAAVIALFGVAGVWLLEGGGGQDAAEAPMAASDGAATGSGVPVAVTDNDFDEQELRRLAVNVDFSGLVPPELPAPAATPLAEEHQRELLDLTAPQTTAEEAAEPQPGLDREDDGDEGGARAESDGDAGFEAMEAEGVVARCLPTVLEGARSELIPVYVELARFDGEPAVIYTLVGEDPESNTYRRVEVWALARSDCQVLGFAQYDRE